MNIDMLIEKFKDFVKFLVFIAILLGIAYWSGYLKGFTPNDFKNAYYTLFPSASNGTSTRYNGYLPSVIPKEVKKSAFENRLFVNVLSSNKKTIFYAYGNSANHLFTRSFHEELQKYINDKSLTAYYDVYAMSYNSYKYMRAGSRAPSNICNSLEECKAQRDHAANYASLQAFFEKCANSMCIFNPTKNQYVILRKKDPQGVVDMIRDLKNW